MKAKRFGAAATAVAIVWTVGQAAAAPTPEQKCEGSKNDAAGKYAACVLKARKGFLSHGDVAKYDAAITNCGAKLGTGWSRAETAAQNAGTTCPTVGDGEAIRLFEEACQSSVADALAGNPLLQDVVSCNSDLGTCEDVLDASEAELSVCDAALEDCQSTLGGTLNKTGQTQCWNDSGTTISCSGTGHDGAIRAGATRSYTDNGDGTITDNITKLMWEKMSDNGSIHDKDTNYTYANAFSKINTLNSTAFAGYTDWRLPNLFELESLPDYGRYNPAVNPVFHTGCTAGCNGVSCSCTGSVVYHTSTTYLGVPEATWRINMTDGDVYAGYKSDTNLRVRAVRSAN